MSAAKPFKLEQEPLWKEAFEIAEYMYGTLPGFPHGEEWGVAAKMRSASADCLLWVSFALGNPGTTSREYEWASARKHACALKAMYLLATRQQFVVLEPAVVVRLDKLIFQIDAERLDAIEQDEKQAAMERQKELKSWLEKYEIWKKLKEERDS